MLVRYLHFFAKGGAYSFPGSLIRAACWQAFGGV